jgi:hypothetical protein
VHFFSILAHTPTDGDDKTVSNDENANTVPILRFGSSTGKKVGTQTLDSPTANANQPAAHARNRPSPPPPPRVVAPARTAPPRHLPCPHSRCARDSRDFAIGDVFAAAAAGLANSSMSTTASREIWWSLGGDCDSGSASWSLPSWDRLLPDLCRRGADSSRCAFLFLPLSRNSCVDAAEIGSRREKDAYLRFHSTPTQIGSLLCLLCWTMFFPPKTTWMTHI